MENKEKLEELAERIAKSNNSENWKEIKEGIIYGYQLAQQELYSEEEVLENLKAKLEVKAGVICEPLLKLGKNPKEDEEVKKVFLTLAHLEEVISYINQYKNK